MKSRNKKITALLMIAIHFVAPLLMPLSSKATTNSDKTGKAASVTFKADAATAKSNELTSDKSEAVDDGKAQITLMSNLLELSSG
ncbi:Uncharacterised protein [Edwardsiella tarda]|nr:Uncharacterised protein [Edwardsiella tarda]